MAKRILALTLCLLLAPAASALASPGDATLFAHTDDTAISVNSLCAHDGVLYVIASDGLYRHRLGEEAPVRLADLNGIVFSMDDFGNPVLDPETPASPTHLFSRDGALYGFNAEIGCFGAVEIGETAALKDPVIFDWPDVFPTYSAFYFQQAALDGETLYVSADAPDGDQRALYAMDTARGSVEMVEGGQNSGFAVAGPGKLLLLCRDESAPPRLEYFEPVDGARETVYQFADEAQIDGLACDEETGEIYYRTGGTIYVLPQGGAPRAVNYAPGGVFTPLNALLLPEHYVGYSDNGVYVRSREPAQEAPRPLRIQGYTELGNFLYRFAAKHPEIPVLTLDGYIDDITASMLSGSADVDIYGVSAKDEGFAALRERGYLYDLSAGEAIRAAIDDMPENIAGVLTVDGKYLAVPFNVIPQCWVYRRDVLEELGLAEADLPRDWPAFAEFIADFPQTHGANHPELSPFSVFMRYTGNLKFVVLNAFFEDYLSACAFAGRAADFEAPAFRDVLALLDRIDFDQFDLDEAERANLESDEDGLRESGLLQIDWNQIALTPWRSEGIGGLPLAIAPGEETVINGDMQVLFVNPNSKNLDLALLFLEEFCRDMDPVLKLNLSATWREPYEDPYYWQNLEYARQAVAETEELLAVCAEENRPDVEAYLAEQRVSLRKVEAERYAIDEKQIDEYRKIQDRICFDNARALGGKGLVELYAEMLRYLGGELNADQFAAALQQKANMIRMEGY